eukprot:TRINITY_DN1535_c0_g1_i2.p2 TRINITY_DN1535_c0_g1~~TRINITY_DN1535_c0_g1_i2.p2  ORF type:complete len:527 (+),score=80.62 TRINITY_DN1535_c0_g1_i2:2773-4353(+)
METDEYMIKLAQFDESQQSRPLLQRIFEGYMDPITKKVNKDQVVLLAKEYENQTGQQISDLFDALPLFCYLFGNYIQVDPDVEDYTLEQLYDTLCNPCFSESFIDKNPVTLKTEQETLRLVRTVPKVEFEKASVMVLQMKFDRYLTLIKEIIWSYTKKDQELEREALSDMIDKICVISKLAIADVTQVLENNGKIPSNSLLISEHFLDHALPTSNLDEVAIKESLQDFMKETPNFLAIDLNNELGLYKLPDPPECKREESDEFLEQLKATIKRYEGLIKEQFEKGIDTAPTEKLLAALKKQLEDYLSSKTSRSNLKTKVSPWCSPSKTKRKKKLMTREETQTAALKEIFEFYNRQRAMTCIRKTFDGADEESTQMPMGYFMKVIKDFGITLPVQKQKELFIKTALGGRYLRFEHFVKIMEKVAVEWNLHKSKELGRDRDLIVFKINRNEKKLEETPINTIEGEKLKEKAEKLNKELSDFDQRINSMKEKESKIAVEELYEFMGIYDANCVVLLKVILIQMYSSEPN